MKKIILMLILLIFFLSNSNSQEFKLANHPPLWSQNRIYNSVSYMFPFEDNKTFKNAAVYFEKTENSQIITMRFRVFPNFSFDELYMKELPEMLVKLGDGTILKGKKERITYGIINAQYVFDVYFNLSEELQNKIIAYGIEKARIAYVYNYLGLNKNQIFDAYTKNCIEDLNAGMFLLQIKDANMKKAKQDSEKNNLDYNF